MSGPQSALKVEKAASGTAGQGVNAAMPVSEEMIAAAGFNINNPIINSLIGNIKGTLPTKKTGTTNLVRCDICNCEMSSELVLNSHLNGAKHKKKVKAMEIVTQLQATGEKGVELGKKDDPNAYRCEICSLTVNSAQQLEVHIAGAKHRNKAAKAGIEVSSLVHTNPSADDSDGAPPAKKKKKEEVMLSCDVCSVIMNSQQQYDQHVESKKHKNKVNPPPKILHPPQGKKGKMKFVHFESGGKQLFDNSRFQISYGDQNNSQQQTTYSNDQFDSSQQGGGKNFFNPNKKNQNFFNGNNMNRSNGNPGQFKNKNNFNNFNQGNGNFSYPTNS